MMNLKAAIKDLDDSAIMRVLFAVILVFQAYAGCRILISVAQGLLTTGNYIGTTIRLNMVSAPLLSLVGLALIGAVVGFGFRRPWGFYLEAAFFLLPFAALLQWFTFGGINLSFRDNPVGTWIFAIVATPMALIVPWDFIKKGRTRAKELRAPSLPNLT